MKDMNPDIVRTMSQNRMQSLFIHRNEVVEQKTTKRRSEYSQRQKKKKAL